MSVFKSLGSFCFQNWLTIFIIESEWTMSFEREVWCDIPRANIWPLVTQTESGLHDFGQIDFGAQFFSIVCRNYH